MMGYCKIMYNLQWGRNRRKCFTLPGKLEEGFREVVALEPSLQEYIGVGWMITDHPGKIILGRRNCMCKGS